MKKCIDCGEEKSLDEFYKGKNACKTCVSVKAKKYRKENREVLKERQKQYTKTYRQRHPDRYKKAMKRWMQTPRGRFKSYRYGAATRKLKFGLSFEQFMTFWQQDCHYCLDPIMTVGLDRVDNDGGYKMDNLVSCCETCNRMKLMIGYEAFLAHIHKIARTHPRLPMGAGDKNVRKGRIPNGRTI